MPAARTAWLLVFILATPLPAQPAGRPKKLIATGWDHVDAARLRLHLAEMEKRPFHGVVLQVDGRVDDKRTCAMRATFSSQPWREEWFGESLADLKACRFARFTDNFLLVGANPGDVDWFDDAGWAHIVEHWRIAARLARQANFRGLLFDPEPYTPPHAQFSYNAQAGKKDHTFEQYAAQARRRGREVMRTIAAEHDRIVVFCYFLNSVLAHAAAQTDPGASLTGEGYGLLPAFLDGWLDEAPPGVTFVDGCENAYRHNSPLQYLESAAAIRGDCQALVAPENRAKYRAQVQVGFGLYLDAYVNPPTSPWHIDPKGGTPAARLKANVRTALRVADEYVWVYGEKHRWWPTPNGRVQPTHWPQVLRGCDRILAMAGDPCGFAREYLSGGPKTVVRNGDFSAQRVQDDHGRVETWREGAKPPGWGAWRHETSKGTFTWDRQSGCGAAGSARAAGVANGCLLQSIPVQPGQTYALRARCRKAERGQVLLTVQWQKADGSWNWSVPGKTFAPQSPVSAPVQTAPAWQQILGVVDVPEEVGRLAVLLSVKGQEGEDDQAWFDDVAVAEIREE